MLVLTIRTDKPEAEIGLFEDSVQQAYTKWYAHRELSVTLHQKIQDLLASVSRTAAEVDGIVGFAGPGSFTGLRIGLTVANALAYSLQKPVVASSGEDWIITGINRLQNGESIGIALPEYGAPVHITQQKR
jgi:tRNA threonylcarbamoyladenosine biosynthesis protein TsaB